MKIGMLLSGGIDSMMAAGLLQEQNHEVIGITMITQDGFDLSPAAEAAAWLGIEHHTVDMRTLFQEKVINYFCSTYEKGETPNPCVMCNQYVKLGALFKEALRLGCEKVATGHYARITYEPPKNLYALRKGADTRKDQSYFLYRLPQEVLSRLVFPLGDFTKEQVRQMAALRNFPQRVTQGAESQDICFLTSDYRDFLQGRVQLIPGEFVDDAGKVFGKHKGIVWYTIGQRKGLGISAPHPLYVLNLNPKTRKITLGRNEQLFRQTFILNDCVWMAPDTVLTSGTVQVKIRYAAAPVAADIELKSDRTAHIRLTEPQRAITPGQSAVFYRDDRVLGGGIISSVES